MPQGQPDITQFDAQTQGLNIQIFQDAVLVAQLGDGIIDLQDRLSLSVDGKQVVIYDVADAEIII